MFDIPHRDVRFIDPTVRPALPRTPISSAHPSAHPAAQVPTAYPTAILIREKALVVNLESIRMVISPTKVGTSSYQAAEWGEAPSRHITLQMSHRLAHDLMSTRPSSPFRYC
jgi:hypothetical protein